MSPPTAPPVVPATPPAPPGARAEAGGGGGVPRGPRLCGYPGGQGLGALAGRLPAAGVQQGKRPASPGGVVGDPVPGHPGSVRDDRLPAAEDPVHQRRLADVRPADDGHDRRGLPGSLGRARCVGAQRIVEGARGSGLAGAHVVHAPALLLSASLMISRMTSSRPRAVVSISTASAALTICGASEESRRACSARVTATVADGSAARSPVRLRAPTVSRAVRDTLTRASGAPTRPISPPPATLPPP